MMHSLMVQGTSSGAGKSIITAGLCRLLIRRGIKTAPFKAQNMALNSYVTPDGLEIGRAQALQASACYLEPDVRMNPILLKPESDKKSMVILNGKPYKKMSVKEYHNFMPDAFDYVARAYSELAKEYDVVILEGAGSPAEINLRDKDIVNMKMAEYANADIVITADIDRGGVYANMFGTYSLIEDKYKKYIKAWIINKFRGDKTLLKDGNIFIEEKTGIPVIGIVPYVELNLPGEDSLDMKNNESLKNGELDIAVIRLSRISNFTDFDPLKIEPDVSLRWVKKVNDLGRPDVLIIPGTKSVVDDLKLTESFKEQILGLLNKKKTEIIGICGGLQILGREITDPDGIESSNDRVKGLGLLPINTRMVKKKTLKQVKGICINTGEEIKGYEIHHGITVSEFGEPVFMVSDQPEGISIENGRIWGTYIHGIFENNKFRRGFLNRIRKNKGLKPINKITAYDIDSELDRFADILESSGVTPEGLELC